MTETPLPELQRWFLRLVTRGDEGEQTTPNDLEELIRRPPTESAWDRVGIYRHAYRARLEECLADDYPALKFCLGEREFFRVCEAYIAARRPQGPNLNHYGGALSAFLLRTEPALDFEAELASLEWALVEAIHAPTPKEHLLERLGQLTSNELAELRLVSSPTACLLRTAYPVNAYFQAFLEGKGPVRPARAPSYVVAVRKETKLWRLDLDEAEATVLARLLAGQPLGTALTGVSQGPSQVQRWFSRWASAGVFTACR